MKLTVNGLVHRVTPEQAAMTLLDFLREVLDLTGAKESCGIGICGSCTVIADGEAIPACHVTVADVNGKSIQTIEGLRGEVGKLHPLQQAFIDCGAVQCGFCIPGLIMTAHAFLQHNSSPTREQIRRAIAGNLCRCTGYQQIIDAIEAAAVHYREETSESAITES